MVMILLETIEGTLLTLLIGAGYLLAGVIALIILFLIIASCWPQRVSASIEGLTWQVMWNASPLQILVNKDGISVVLFGSKEIFHKSLKKVEDEIEEDLDDSEELIEEEVEEAEVLEEDELDVSEELDESEEVIEEEAEELEEGDTDVDTEADKESEEEELEEPDLEEGIEEEKNRIELLSEKWDLINEKIALFMQLWEREKRVVFKLLKWLKFVLLSSFKLLKPFKVNITFKGGFSDPLFMGYLYGFSQIVSTFPVITFLYVPDFMERKEWYGKGEVSYSFTLLHFILFLFLIVITIPYFSLFGAWRRYKKEGLLIIGSNKSDDGEPSVVDEK